jgi:hypothetical protein
MFPTDLNDTASDSPEPAGETMPPSPEWNADRPEYQAFARFASMTREVRQLERRIKELRGRMEGLEFQLRDYLGASGYQQVKVGGYTIYLRRDIHVRARDRARTIDICAALKANGMGHFVAEQYQVSALSGHVRELERNHREELEAGELADVSELLPPAVRAVLNTDPKYSVIALEARKR